MTDLVPSPPARRPEKVSGTVVNIRDPLALEVVDRWKKIDDDLVTDRRNYWLNHAFYCGQQWLKWDSSHRTPRMMPETNERVLTTSNQIRPRINRLVGRLSEVDLFFDVPATAADDPSTSGAILAADLLETRRVDDDWESIREQNLFNSLFGGTAGISQDWDSTRGKLWTDDVNGGLVGEGEALIQSWSIAEFGLEPGSPTKDKARYWEGCRCLPVEQVQAAYELNWKPQPDASTMHSPMQRRLLADRQRTKADQLVAVYVLYERPNDLCREGRIVHVVNNRCVVNTSWTFPFDELNIEIFRQSTLPGSWRGDTCMNDARQLQVQYNSVRSNLLEHTKLAGNARLWVAAGSVDDIDALTDEPGEIHEWNSSAGPKPEYSMPAPLPRSLTQQQDDIKAELDDVLYAHDVSRGIGPDRASGLAVATLAEHNDTPLGPMGRREAACWSRIGTNVLKLYETNATEKRTAVVMKEIAGAPAMPHQFSWNGERLRGQHRVRVPQDVTLPLSRTVMQAQLTNLKAAWPEVFANVPASTLARMMRLPNQDQLAEVLDADAASAIFENGRLAVDEVQIPQSFHKHDVHIAEHNQLRNSPQWQYFSDATKQMIDAHIQAHQRYVEEQTVQQNVLNQQAPGLAGMPQADAPPGSALPPPARTLRALPGGNAA